MAENRAERRRRERAIAKFAAKEIEEAAASYSEKDAKFAAMLKGLFGEGGDVGQASRVDLDVYPDKIIKIPPGLPMEPLKIEGRRIEVEIRDDPFGAIEKLEELGKQWPEYESKDGFGEADSKPEGGPRPDDKPEGGQRPPQNAQPELGYQDRKEDTARRHRQVVTAIPLGPTLRNGKAIYEYKAHELHLRNGGTRHPDGNPWEIAEARLDEWLIHCGAQASQCGCVRPHADHEGRMCSNTAVVMTVWGNHHVPFCGPCAHAEVQLNKNKKRGGSYTRGVLVLDWVPDDV